MSRVAYLLGCDPLFELPNVGSQQRQVVTQPIRHSGGDRVGQGVGGGGAQAAGLQAPENRLRLQQCDLRVDRRVEWPVHGDEITRTNQPVQLDIVHVSRIARLGRVEDHERVVRVHLHLGDSVALDAVVHREGMEAEHLGQHGHRPLVGLRNVNPDDAVRQLEQRSQLIDLISLDP